MLDFSTLLASAWAVLVVLEGLRGRWLVMLVCRPVLPNFVCVCFDVPCHS